MMKRCIFLLLWFSTTSLMAHIYDQTILMAEIRLFPKIIFLDEEITSKLVDGSVVFAVVFDEKDRETAELLKNKMEREYQGGQTKWPLMIELVPVNHFDSARRVSAVYGLRLKAADAKKVVNLAREAKILTFAYACDDLALGFMVSVRFEARTMIYFNFNAWKTQQVQLVENFYKIVKLYE